MSYARALGLIAGFAADRAVGDPRRGHPVAGFGRLAGALESRLWTERPDGPQRRAGVLFAVVLAGGSGVLGGWLDRRSRTRPGAEFLVTAASTWVVLGGRSLEQEARSVTDRLQNGDLPGARQRVARIVGRDTSVLDRDGVARAVVETLAENTSDAVIAPLVLGGLAGPAGLFAYRATNTLDAMVGHRTARYEHFGWASARLDDVLNLPGSRLTAILTVLSAPAVGGRRLDSLQTWRRDAAAHPSPNAGPVEAAVAGALGVRLGGRTVYRERVEMRPELGDGPAPGAEDIERAVRLARLIGGQAALVAAGLAVAVGLRRRRRVG